MNRAFSPSACLCCLAAGLWLALPQQGYSATVLTGINQFGSTANLGYAFINDDIGATYNSATLDLSAILGTVVDAIVANNPLFATTAQVYGAMAMGITNTGDVYVGWSTTINTTTGLASFTHGPGDADLDFTLWTSATNQNTMTGTLNLGNLLDFNGNGIIDPNETLAFDGLASAAFVGTLDNNNSWSAAAPRLTVIPEPGSAWLVAAGLGALAWRRRRAAA